MEVAFPGGGVFIRSVRRAARTGLFMQSEDAS
jgi:hypothetical protein